MNDSQCLFLDVTLAEEEAAEGEEGSIGVEWVSLELSWRRWEGGKGRGSSARSAAALDHAQHAAEPPS